MFCKLITLELFVAALRAPVDAALSKNVEPCQESVCSAWEKSRDSQVTSIHIRPSRMYPAIRSSVAPFYSSLRATNGAKGGSPRTTVTCNQKSYHTCPPMWR